MDVLQRSRTDHALWQHNLARRLAAMPDEASAPAIKRSSMLRQAVEPDLRLRIIEIASFDALGPNTPRLIARCAILPDEDAADDVEDEAEPDEGTVVFSVALMASSSGSGGPGIPPPPALVAAAARHRRTASDSSSSASTLAAIFNPADLHALLVVDAEVWVFEPWTVVSLPPPNGEEEATRALICTRFAVLKM